jgi:hypothetical protein
LNGFLKILRKINPAYHPSKTSWAQQGEDLIIDFMKYLPFNDSGFLLISAIIKESKFEKVIISGFANYFFSWIELLKASTKIEVLFHGTISEFHEREKQDFVRDLIKLGKSGDIKRFGFVKEGLDHVFKTLYGFDCFHQPLTNPIIPSGLAFLKLDKTKIHVGVFGADTFNKNLHNQVIHALMIENVIVHVLDKSIFEISLYVWLTGLAILESIFYIGCIENIINHFL